MPQAETITVPVKLEVSGAVTVRPGSTLVIGLHDAPSQEAAKHLKEQMEERLPGVEMLVVCGVAAMAAYEPDEVQKAGPENDVFTWAMERPSGKRLHLHASCRSTLTVRSASLH